MSEILSFDDLDGSADRFDRLFDQFDAGYDYNPYDCPFGIPDDDNDDDYDPEWDLFLSECREDEELELRQADADEAELYKRLERPRKRRQKQLPTYHFKRWGHGNAAAMLRRVDELTA